MITPETFYPVVLGDLNDLTTQMAACSTLKQPLSLGNTQGPEKSHRRHLNQTQDSMDTLQASTMSP